MTSPVWLTQACCPLQMMRDYPNKWRLLQSVLLSCPVDNFKNEFRNVAQQG